jgi:hypothetical protein
MSRAARISIHMILIPIMLSLAAIVGWTAGDYHWPYVVDSIEVEPDPVYAGATLKIVSVRQFLDDCDLEFERQLESVEHRNMPPVILADERSRTPWRFNGKPQPIFVAIPSDFPCGAAQIRTSPSASCNWLQKGWLRQTKADVITPFDVACR